MYARNAVPEDASRKYFWRIYSRPDSDSQPPPPSSSSASSATSGSDDKVIPTDGTGSGEATPAPASAASFAAECEYHYIDGADPEQSNWMRYVNPAYSSGAQNLVACQVRQAIYFYTIRPIKPNQELLVWYCKEFAQRLNYPLSGEQMMLRIRK